MDRSVRDRGLYAFGSFRLDPTRRLLTREGAPVALTPTVFDTLLYLVENSGRVVSKEELLDAVWPRRLVEEANITQTVFTLRKALGDTVDGARLIATAPGRGYRFTEAVRLEGGAPAFTAPSPTAPPGGRSVPRRLAILGVAALCLSAVMGAGLLVAFWPWRAAHGPAARSFMVLAQFQNLTGDPIFDRTLGKVLEIDLAESPFLAVLPEGQVGDTLALMIQPKDAPLTPALAREVCARTDSGAVIEGAIAAIGSRYLMTLTATDCAGARTLAAEKTEVTGREAVIPALDRLVGRVRGKLGEGTRSVLTFDVPMARQRTVSLTALKAYSEGDWLYSHGRPVESIPLFQRAIDLDPDFAAAYAALSTVYADFYETKLDVANISRAYALKDTVGEREKLFIVARYHQSVTRDLNAAIRNLQVWSETYPRDPLAWKNLADAEDYLGRYLQEIEAAKRALALDPGLETAYAALARAYLGDGRLTEAKAVCLMAVGKGLDGDGVHETLLRIAFMRHDLAGFNREIAWARGRPAERRTLAMEDEIALGQGKVGEADGWFDRLTYLGQQQGLPDDSRASRARSLADIGLTNRARALLVGDDGDANPDYLIALAEIDDPARAEALLARSLRLGPDDTLLNNVYAPQARAVLALRRAQPQAAIAALQSALPYESCDFDVPYLLGSAFLAAGDGARAALEFQKILDHQGWEATSPRYPLARLGLARALRLRRDLVASRREYEAFLATWKNADPDVPILRAAKAEYAGM